jgi:hypothetical protein
MGTCRIVTLLATNLNDLRYEIKNKFGNWFGSETHSLAQFAILMPTEFLGNISVRAVRGAGKTRILYKYQTNLFTNATYLFSLFIRKLASSYPPQFGGSAWMLLLRTRTALYFFSGAKREPWANQTSSNMSVASLANQILSLAYLPNQLFNSTHQYSSLLINTSILVSKEETR